MRKTNTACYFSGLVIALTLVTGCTDLKSNESLPSLSAKAEAQRNERAMNHTESNATRMPDKVTISFSLESARLTLHEPVLLYFTVTNGLSYPIKFDLGQDRKERFLLTVTQPDGATIKLPQLRRDGISLIGTVSLEAGNSYTQRLLLNEWFEFSVAGKYEIAAELENPILAYNGTKLKAAYQSLINFEIVPRSAERLTQVCMSLVKRITNSISYEAAAEAALALSYIKDPIAVPYLREAVTAGRMVEPIAITGLERIGDAEAAGVLISILENGGQETAALARFALSRIEQKTSDSMLKTRIKRILQEG